MEERGFAIINVNKTPKPSLHTFFSQLDPLRAHFLLLRGHASCTPNHSGGGAEGAERRRLMVGGGKEA